MQREIELTVADSRYPNQIFKTTKSAYLRWYANARYNNIPFDVAGTSIPRDNLRLRSDINNNWYSWDTILPTIEHGTNYTKAPVASGYYPTGGRKRSRRRKQKKSRRRKQKKSRRSH
jgi:hypothetical protein